MIPDRIRVLLADDHAVLRGGLRALLGLEPDMDVVGELSTGEEAIERVRAHRGHLPLAPDAEAGTHPRAELVRFALETGVLRARH